MADKNGHQKLICRGGKNRRFAIGVTGDEKKWFKMPRISIISYQYLMLQTGHIHSGTNGSNHINLTLKQLFHD